MIWITEEERFDFPHFMFFRKGLTTTNEIALFVFQITHDPSRAFSETRLILVCTFQFCFSFQFRYVFLLLNDAQLK